MMIRLSIIMPVYNEENTVEEVAAAVLRQESVHELVVVDDCSSDATGRCLEGIAKNDPRVKVLRHKTNQGKGAALQTGFKHAQGDVVGVQDADLEYDPSEYERMLEPFRKYDADVVYGSRFQKGGEHRVVQYWHSMGNRFLTILSNMFSNLSLTDMDCYKFFRREVLDSIELKEKRFGVEPEITAKIARISNLKIYEVPINYNGRTYEEGKKIGWKDGMSAIRCIVRYNIFK